MAGSRDPDDLLGRVKLRRGLASFWRVAELTGIPDFCPPPPPKLLLLPNRLVIDTVYPDRIGRSASCLRQFQSPPAVFQFSDLENRRYLGYPRAPVAFLPPPKETQLLQFRSKPYRFHLVSCKNRCNHRVNNCDCHWRSSSSKVNRRYRKPAEANLLLSKSTKKSQPSSPSVKLDLASPKKKRNGCDAVGKVHAATAR